jgi:hypothetical protein
MKISRLFILAFCLTSCNGESYEKITSVAFTKNITLAGESIANELITLPPSQIEIIDSLLFLFTPGGGVLAKTISLKNGDEILDWGYIGRGDKEFLAPFFAGQSVRDSTFSIYDVSTRILKKFKWEDVAGEFTHKEISEKTYKGAVSIFSATVLDNEYTISKSIGNSDGVLVVLDKDMQIVTSFCNPFNAPREDLRALTGFISGRGNFFVYAMIEVGYIGGFEISDNGSVITKWEYLLTEPIYEKTPKFRFVDGVNKRGFFDVKVTPNYVFTLFSGAHIYDDPDNVPSNVLVFRHDGTPVVNIKLDVHCGRIAVTEDENTFYVHSLLDDIVKYRIDDF